MDEFTSYVFHIDDLDGFRRMGRGKYWNLENFHVKEEFARKETIRRDDYDLAIVVKSGITLFLKLI